MSNVVVRQTLPTWIRRALDEIQTAFPEADVYSQYVSVAGLPRVNDYHVFGTVLGFMGFELEGYATNLLEQMLPTRARGDYLEVWTSIVGMTRKLPTAAAGVVTFTGTPGALINGLASGAPQKLTAANGQKYSVVDGGTIGGDGTVALEIEADVEGIDGNAIAYAPLSLDSLPAGLTAIATADSLGLYGGSATETDRNLRARLLFRLANPPATGSVSDFQNWALEMPGVTRAWAYPTEVVGPGTVAVVFMMDETYADGLPTNGDEAAMHAHLRSTAPAHGTILCGRPRARQIHVSISDLVYSTSDVVPAIETALQDVILNRGKPGTPGTTEIFSRSWLVQAVANTAGELRHGVIVPPDLQLGRYELPVWGSLTIHT